VGRLGGPGHEAHLVEGDLTTRNFWPIVSPTMRYYALISSELGAFAFMGLGDKLPVYKKAPIPYARNARTHTEAHHPLAELYRPGGHA